MQTAPPDRAKRYPDLFICGAPRCGTTFLWSALRAHPEVFMSVPKEPNFFSADLDTGTAAEGRSRVRERSAYLALFASAAPGQLLGEASTSTLLSREALPAILAVAPGARFILSLRDPVEAIASRHAQLRSAGFEDLALADALDAEEERAHGRRRARRPTFPWSFPYVAGARYGEQLGRLFESVQRERVLVLLLDDIAAEPRAAVSRMTSFLGIAPLPRVVATERNASRTQRPRPLFEALFSPVTVSVAKRLVPARGHALAGRLANAVNRSLRPRAARQPLPPAMRDRLRAALHDDLERASALLGEDLAARWWRTGPT